MSDGLIIVGGSYAACEIAHAARSHGFDGPIRILTEEAELPYHRPPLSKAFLLDPGDGYLPLKAEKSYTDQRIDVEFNQCVSEIDIDNSRVRLRGGRTVGFDKLAIATGARARRLQIPGADLEGVLYLRSIAEARALKASLAPSTRVVVIGGGFIGLEVASAAAQLGKAVTVLEAQPELLMRVVSSPIARFLAEAHRAAGVDIRTSAKVVAIRGEGGHVAQVVLDDHSAIEADLVIVGIGSLPNSEIAQAAGLMCKDGIVVDACGQTSHERIWAAGDCAFYAGRYTAAGLRLESVQNATDQARCVGANIAGQSKLYESIPWFWSDQYKFKLQITGISMGHTAFHEKADPDGMSVFYFRNDDCIAVDTINRPRDHMAARRVLAAGITRAQLEASDYDLPMLLKMQARPGAAAVAAQ